MVYQNYQVHNQYGDLDITKWRIVPVFVRPEKDGSIYIEYQGKLINSYCVDEN